jgi:hypothetical protein
VEVTDDDSEQMDDDASTSRSKESDAAEEIAAARMDRSIGRASAKSQYWIQAQLLHPQGKVV